MRTDRRFVTRSLAVLAVAALGLTACSDDDDDEAPSETTESSAASEDTGDGSSELSIPDISIPDISIPDISIPDISIPDISVPNISIPDISLPDISVPDPEEILGRIFPGLDDGQISCLADSLDNVSNIDAAQVLDLIDDCNIQMSDLTGGG